MRKKIIWFPVENGVREIPARLLFGMLMAERGWVTCIGHKNSIDAMVGSSDPGIYIYKNTHAIAKGRYQAAKKAGNITIGLEEEILNFSEVEVLNSKQFDHQCDARAMTELDFYISSNRADTTLAKAKASDTAVLDLGNLRSWYSTLWRGGNADSRCVRVSGRLGTLTGPALSELLGYNMNVLPFTDALHEMRKDLVEEFSILEEIYDLIEGLKGDNRVIFRPHPAEKSDLYRRVWGDAIDYDEGSDPVQHGFLDVKLLIGFSCTTLLEATLSGIRVANLGQENTNFLSDRYITKVSVEHVKSGGCSVVDTSGINHELYNPVDVAENWTIFFEELGSDFSRVQKLCVAETRLEGYALKRYGFYNELSLGVDVSAMKRALGRSPECRIKRSGSSLIVLPEA